jgi:Ca-activated chloride channel homolog
MPRLTITNEDIFQRAMQVTGPPPPIDVVLLIDTSGSMEAADMVPHRLGAAREAALCFANRKILKGGDDRVAVITFGGEPTKLCDLTLDHDAAKAAVEGIAAFTHSSTGIGSALQAAAKLLPPTPAGKKGSAKDESDLETGAPGFRAPKAAKDAEGARRRAIILLTDGESYVGPDPRKVASTLDGIMIFTIGIGSPAGVELDIPGVGLTRVRLDEALLRDLAVRTGGEYFHAPTSAHLLRIYELLADV